MLHQKVSLFIMKRIPGKLKEMRTLGKKKPSGEHSSGRSSELWCYHSTLTRAYYLEDSHIMDCVSLRVPEALDLLCPLITK